MSTQERSLTGGNMTVRRALLLDLILLGVLVPYFLLWPVPIEPVQYIPSRNPGMTGPFTQNETLVGVQHLIKGVGQRPEDVIG